MKIAFITRTCNKKGGISRCVAELAEIFSHTHEVHIFANSWQDISSDKIIFHKVPMLKGNFFLQRKKAGLATILQVYSFVLMSKLKIRPSNFDIVHSYGDCFIPFDVYTSQSSHKTAVRVARNSGWGTYNYLKNTILNPLNLIVFLIEKFSYQRRGSKKNVIIISPTEWIKREIIADYKTPEENIIVIPNGVDINEFNPKNREEFRDEVRKELNIKKDDLVLIFIAYEFKRKGLKYIIEALPLIKSERVKLIVIGRDKIKPYVFLSEKLKVAHQIIFLQPTPLKRYYAASDIFVFPTLYEAFSLATLEAIASGLPIVATKVSGTEELIEDGYNGFFIQRDALDIAQKISFFLENEHCIKQMGENARRTAEGYSWEKVARQTEEIYKKIHLLKSESV
ncbi:MAG: glycosyltransferase family 4 protein [bacterium]